MSSSSKVYHPIVARRGNIVNSNFASSILLRTTIYFLTIQKALSVNPVLNLKEDFPYLISKIDGKTIEPRDYMDFDNIYAPNETYKWQQTPQGRIYHLVKAFDFANYYQSDFWHYSNEADLLVSAHPVADADRCAQQLNWLEHQLNTSGILFHRGQEHINLASLMDAFGRPEAGANLGHIQWLGSYYECKQVAIDILRFELEERCGQEVGRGNGADGCKNVHLMMNISGTAGGASASGHEAHGKGPPTLLKARYCIGKARDLDWPSEQEDNYVPRISYKIGLCLPESCETVSFQKHRAQLERLMLFNMPQHLRSRITLNDIYCLPDERSPIRALSLSARVFLGICCTWLILSLVASWLYSNYTSHQRGQHIKQMKLVRAEKKVKAILRLEAIGDRQQQQVVLKLSGICKQDNNNSITNNGGLEMDAKTPPLKNGQQHQQLVHAQPEVTREANSNGGSPQLLAIRSQIAPLTSPILGNTGGVDPRVAAAINEPAQQNNNEEDDDDDDAEDENEDEHHQYHFIDEHQSRSSNYNLSALLSSWLASWPPLLIDILRAMSIRVNVAEFHEAPLLLRKRGGGRDDNNNNIINNNSKRLRINLNGLDFIKCLCCLLVIFGHIIFIQMQHLSNILYVIEQANGLASTILIAFFNFVDTFFIISGMLTAYFIFKRFTKRTFASPMIWLSITMLRLARLSPVYILTFWFAKTLTVHLSDGPIWDYGTDKRSIKGLCINDHWWKSILYLGNLNTIQPLCILPAWSIILDAQYSIILPPIIYLIFLNKRLGYASLLLGIIISTTNMSIQLATQTAVKTSDMATVRLHVYPLISRFATEFYNTPWNRLGPVAIGIMGGHMLHLYDVGKLRRWPWFMRGWPFKLNLLAHLIILALPTIGLYTGRPQPAAASGDDNITMFVISNATIKPIWSLINTMFLLRLITDLSERKSSFMSKLVSRNIWHCLGKLCFSAYLIHYEIIMILLKSRREGLLDQNWWNAAREFSCALLFSITVAFLVYILFEAPINKLIMLFIVKPSYRDNNEEANSIIRRKQANTSILLDGKKNTVIN